MDGVLGEMGEVGVVRRGHPGDHRPSAFAGGHGRSRGHRLPGVIGGPGGHRRSRVTWRMGGTGGPPARVPCPPTPPRRASRRVTSPGSASTRFDTIRAPSAPSSSDGDHDVGDAVLQGGDEGLAHDGVGVHPAGAREARTTPRPSCDSGGTPGPEGGGCGRTPCSAGPRAGGRPPPPTTRRSRHWRPAWASRRGTSARSSQPQDQIQIPEVRGQGPARREHQVELHQVLGGPGGQRARPLRAHDESQGHREGHCQGAGRASPRRATLAFQNNVLSVLYFVRFQYHRRIVSINVLSAPMSAFASAKFA